MSNDPARDGVNWYVYVGNIIWNQIPETGGKSEIFLRDPINNRDPSGMLHDWELAKYNGGGGGYSGGSSSSSNSGTGGSTGGSTGGGTGGGTTDTTTDDVDTTGGTVDVNTEEETVAQQVEEQREEKPRIEYGGDPGEQPSEDAIDVCRESCGHVRWWIFSWRDNECYCKCLYGEDAWICEETCFLFYCWDDCYCISSINVG